MSHLHNTVNISSVSCVHDQGFIYSLKAGLLYIEIKIQCRVDIVAIIIGCSKSVLSSKSSCDFINVTTCHHVRCLELKVNKCELMVFSLS